jgi:hypothetical protein
MKMTTSGGSLFSAAWFALCPPDGEAVGDPPAVDGATALDGAAAVDVDEHASSATKHTQHSAAKRTPMVRGTSITLSFTRMVQHER